MLAHDTRATKDGIEETRAATAASAEPLLYSEQRNGFFTFISKAVWSIDLRLTVYTLFRVSLFGLRSRILKLFMRTDTTQTSMLA